MCAILPDFQLVTSIVCQQILADHHSIWLEGILHYVCQVVVCTKEPFVPISYRFFDRYGLPIATSLIYSNSCCISDLTSLSNNLITNVIFHGNSEHNSFYSRLSDFKLVE